MAKSYNSFTIAQEGVETNSKFIMIIDAVKKEDAIEKQEYIIQNDNKEK